MYTTTNTQNVKKSNNKSRRVTWIRMKKQDQEIDSLISLTLKSLPNPKLYKVTLPLQKQKTLKTPHSAYLSPQTNQTQQRDSQESLLLNQTENLSNCFKLYKSISLRFHAKHLQPSLFYKMLKSILHYNPVLYHSTTNPKNSSHKLSMNSIPNPQKNNQMILLLMKHLLYNKSRIILSPLSNLILLLLLTNTRNYQTRKLYSTHLNQFLHIPKSLNNLKRISK